MNKKILAVAIASAIAAPLAAQADEGNVTLYGSANAAIEFVDVDPGVFIDGEGSFELDDFDAEQVNSNNSVIGVKGWEPLGNGLKAVFLMEAFVGLDGSGSSLFQGGRDGFVGLAGGFGTVALGFHGRPYKTSTNNLDVFGSTIADYSAIMGTVGAGGAGVGAGRVSYFDGGIGNGVIWFLPNLSGFSGHLQYGADEGDDDTNDYGVQFNYGNGPLYASISYDEDGNALGPDSDTDVNAIKGAVSYTFGGATTVTGIYEQIDLDDLGIGDRDAFYVAAAHKFGNNTAKIAYANADDTDIGDDGADYWAVGLSHAMSKRTELYGLYSKIDNDDLGSYSFISAPHTSTGTFDTGGFTAGGESDVFSLGVKHNF